MTDADLAIPAAPPPSPARPRVTMVGTALASAATFMAFVGIIGTYLTVRADVVASGETWIAAGTIPLTPGNMGMATLLMGSVTIQWAVYAIANNDRANGYVALGLTVLFGVAYVNTISFLYTEMGLGISESAQSVLVYAVSGAHVAMVVVACVFATLMVFRTLGGQYSSTDTEGVAAAALFWHVTVAVAFLVWYAVYVVK